LEDKAMGTEFHRLGDHIREVNVRNRELKVTRLLGLSMTKQFRPSTSNIVGVDLSNYKIVNQNTFAFDPMSVIRVHKVPIAINDMATPIIVSPAYYTFEVSDTSKLLPQYLMMWIMRPEFDRYADFKSDSAVRGGYDWKEFCDTPICVPSIERQREIVSEYETLTRRIRLNEQMIEKLEATAQALYRHTFVDNIDKQNLPQGWRLATLGDFGEVITGKTPSTLDDSNFGDYMPFLTIPDMHDGMYALKTERSLSKKGVSSQRNKTIPKNSICVSCIGTSGLVVITTQDCQTNQQINTIVPRKEYALEYIYLTCCVLEKIISEYGMGGAVLNNLNKSDFENLRVVMPSDDVMKMFHEQVSSVFYTIYLKQQEIIKLTELQSLLLAKMGR
jgi:type I restriction enzyme S subunit